MKIMIFDQGNPVCGQLLRKAQEAFSDEAEIVIVKNHRHHNIATECLQHAIQAEKPELLLVGATALGEEIAPALGVRLSTGVASHCIDIITDRDGKTAFIVPAFGGKLSGEIFVSGAKPGRPAIATVKPGILDDPEEKTSRMLAKHRVIDIDAAIDEGNYDAGEKVQGAYRLADIRPVQKSGNDIADSQLIFCGGFGLGSMENWKKLEKLAEKYGGSVGCTRPALDAGWGATEGSMIGTSGRNVKPKVYIGFGISGATHHLCGISKADIIININSDSNAEVFAASDYRGVFDAEAVIEALLGKEKI